MGARSPREQSRVDRRRELARTVSSFREGRKVPRFRCPSCKIPLQMDEPVLEPEWDLSGIPYKTGWNCPQCGFDGSA